MNADESLKSGLDPDDFRRDVQRIESEIGRVIVGHGEVVRMTVTALLAGGHVLIEGVPGLGKTLLMRTLAAAIDGLFSRIQCTPDLMPADILGTNILHETGDGQRSFRFEPGPVFANLVLSDEVNRATPKTQSALLEAMQERTVTVGKRSYRLPEPFFVLATQNPIEMEGTFPLPEAQLDRFLFKLHVPSPTTEELVEIAERTTGAKEPTAQRVVDVERILAMAALARDVPIARPVLEYAARLVKATHPDDPTAGPSVREHVRIGASPRGMQSIVVGAKIHALLDERHHVSRSDIRTMVAPALGHRLILRFSARAEGVEANDILGDVVRSVDAP